MELITAEEFLLVSHDQDGRELTGRIGRTRAVAGALLIDLAMAGLVGMAGDRLVAKAPDSGGLHPELAALLQAVQAEKRPRKAKWWVQRYESREVNRRLLAGLAARGILVEQHQRTLGLLPVARWVEQSPQPRQEIMQRLDAAVANGTADGRTCALAAMTDACGLSGKLFPDVPRPVRKKRMKELSEGNWAAEAVKDAIRAVQAATTAAIAASASAASG